ncbi:MAG TPA: carbamoyl-phosphate synthase (glutamine-hydrolyzing) small subunit [Bacteroidetes bacterium]|nr:carbamoyl-phosphate synthase (glutamine-hydrolyzing) small subunit [Bacteroidota bacterium]
MNAKLILEDGSIFFGTSFGSEKSVAGEVVFNTGMVGYPETLTDPSYAGQILVMTYPLIGNYGVPGDAVEEGLHAWFESERVRVTALVVSEHSGKYSHWNAERSLSQWLKENDVPGIYGIDTRMITQKLRSRGTVLGKVVFGEEYIEFHDPNQENLVAGVSIDEPQIYGEGDKRVVLLDCGCKYNIVRSLVQRGVQVKRVPWDWPLQEEEFDGLVLSNGPGDPVQVQQAAANVRAVFEREKPILGVCLGNQLLAMAAGATTYKLKYGHRSQNQPCVLVGSKRCFITSQNHGYAINEKSLPKGWLPWFFNANDGTNEGIRHKSKPFMSVQFHPEATPGPVDTAFIFDDFIAML